MTIDFGRGHAGHLRRSCFEEIVRLRDSNGRCRTIVRFINYRILAQQVVPKDAACTVKPGNRTVKMSSTYVSEALTWLREHDLVADTEIVDESRSSVTNAGWSSIRDGLIAYVKVVDLDPWDDDPPVLVVESRSLQSFFGLMAAEYRIDIITLGGQASRGYLANDAAGHLDTGTLALVVSDYDKAGADIHASARDRLRVLAPHWRGEWRPVAVADGQFQEFGVRQGLAIMKPDHRFSPPRDFLTLEAEGVEQSVLEASVRDALDQIVPASLAEVRTEEERERGLALAHFENLAR